MARNPNLACPAVSRGTSSVTSSVFNEGVQVPQADWDALTRTNPALASKDNTERYEATKASILTGDLAKYRRR